MNGFDSSLIKEDEKDSFLDEKDMPTILSDDEQFKIMKSFDVGQNQL
jgi:hypothetical protein